MCQRTGRTRNVDERTNERSASSQLHCAHLLPHVDVVVILLLRSRALRVDLPFALALEGEPLALHEGRLPLLLGVVDYKECEQITRSRLKSPQERTAYEELDARLLTQERELIARLQPGRHRTKMPK